MLEYEWGDPSAMVLSGEEPHPNPQLFHHYADTTVTRQSFHHSLFAPQNSTAFSHQNYFHNPNQPQPLFDPRAFSGLSAYSTPHSSLLSLDPLSGAGGTGADYFLVPKTEQVSTPVDFTVRIGLNLGVRTYFSSTDDDFVNRLYRRSRPGSIKAPRCQVEGCNADLTHAKHYHRRHKVCEFHSKASTVIAAGLTQRFCQQCSRCTKTYQNVISHFANSTTESVAVGGDWLNTIVVGRNLNDKPTVKQNQKLHGGNSSTDNPIPTSLGRSPLDSTSRVTSAILSLHSFRQRPYNASASSRRHYF
ncbi:hypothetical protein V6N13_022133 [Hibiscus sabdariffa]|uniref:SBP-type domain-containing protein n=2 Tax=Hibiscus sabdariffa TaxID=183260 RepID=A0ABR2A1J3_9ROSI